MYKILLTALVVFISSESYPQWFVQQSGVSGALYRIQFVNRHTGWACGDDGIIKTTNGGLNWFRQTVGIPSEPLFGMYVVDSNIVYANGFYRTFIKTTNGGNNWISLDSGSVGSGTYVSLFLLNQNTGWLGNFESGAYGIRKTTDGGVTLKTVFFNGIPQDIYFKDDSIGIGVSESSYIYRSVNGGLNWIGFPIAFAGDFYRVSFIDALTGFVSSSRAVFRTVNFGVTWDSIGRVSPELQAVYGLEFTDSMKGWAGTTHGIYRSTNGGRNWVQQVMTGLVYDIYACSDSIVWTCGNGGRIWHTDNGGASSITINSYTPGSFELFQNYPNPFNSSTVIRFRVEKRSVYRLEIFDILGKEISKIFNTSLSTGIYEINFYAGNLPTGIYIYRISSANSSASKKFVLIK